jgi:hypothetical protein
MTRLSVDARLRRGDVLHMQIRNGRRQFWLESPHEVISDVQLYEAGRVISITEAFDSLFGWPGNSQTWHSISKSSAVPAEAPQPAELLP